MGSEQLPYTSGAVDLMPLRGPSGQVFTITRGGENEIQWAPTDRRACDLEMRVGIVGWLHNGALLSAPDPIVRWFLQIGHGSYVWIEPPPALIPQNVPSVARNYLPTRGMVVRLNTRELRFLARFEGNFGAIQTYDNIALSVSFQPVIAMQQPMFPQSELVEPPVALGTGLLHKFPAEAQEWRLFDREGQPFAAGTVDVSLSSVGGGVSGPFDRSVWADFLPISPRMWGWSLTGPGGAIAYAQYR